MRYEHVAEEVSDELIDGLSYSSDRLEKDLIDLKRLDDENNPIQLIDHYSSSSFLNP